MHINMLAVRPQAAASSKTPEYAEPRSGAWEQVPLLLLHPAVSLKGWSSGAALRDDTSPGHAAKIPEM